jgi:hypothetical protein
VSITHSCITYFSIAVTFNRVSCIFLHFFYFSQGVLINILVFTGVISSAFDTSDDNTIKGISNKLQDFLICIEMFLAAVAHHYSFSYKPYVNVAAGQRSCCAAFLAMWDISDVQRDIKEHLGVVGSSLSRHIRGRGMYRYAGASATESSRLLVPESGPAPGDFYNSAPARLGNDGQLSSYDSIASSETATEAASYHGVSCAEETRQDPHYACINEDELLIDFSPDNEEPKRSNIT